MQISLDLKSHLFLIPASFQESPNLLRVSVTQGNVTEGMEEAVHGLCTKPVLHCLTCFDGSTHLQGSLQHFIGHPE